MFTRLFQIFERRSRRSDVVDVAEFLGGVSVFACGERDEKIRLTFELYDSDSDGFISKGEMTKYLTAVYLVISETSPELFHQNKYALLDADGCQSIVQLTDLSIHNICWTGWSLQSSA